MSRNSGAVVGFSSGFRLVCSLLSRVVVRAGLPVVLLVQLLQETFAFVLSYVLYRL